VAALDFETLARAQRLRFDLLEQMTAPDAAHLLPLDAAGERIRAGVSGNHEPRASCAVNDGNLCRNDFRVKHKNVLPRCLPLACQPLVVRNSLRSISVMRS
jgi:hypothetical protein